MNKVISLGQLAFVILSFVFCFSPAGYGQDVGVVQLRGGSCFTKELLCLCGAQFPFARYLDSNGSVKLVVAGLEDNGKGARASL